MINTSGSTNGSTNGSEKYRKVLLDKRADLLSGLCGKLDTVAAEGSVALEDLAPLLHDDFISLQVNQLDSLQIRLIEADLARMDSEKYGVCPDCGDAISRRRLEAIPWAVRCIACQELFSSASRASPSVRSIEPDGPDGLTERLRAQARVNFQKGETSEE